MPYLRWDESAHWGKSRLALVDEQGDVIIEPLPGQRTAKQIAEAIRDDPLYNSANPSNQAHIIELAIINARQSGTLIEEGDQSG